MTTNHISVFLNGHLLSAPAGASLRELLADWEPELHAALAGGGSSAVDARGLPVDPDALLKAGDIFRVGRSARQAAEESDDVDA